MVKVTIDSREPERIIGQVEVYSDHPSTERISKIQKRIMAIDSFPSGINRKTVKDTLKKLNSGKEQKKVQKLLRDCTDGDKSQLNDDEFIKQLVKDTEILNLLNSEGIKPTSLKASLSALLLRTEVK